MANAPEISEKGLAVFAFTIYHQLESGTRVRKIVRDDGDGHRADPEAVEELRELGLLELDGDRVSLAAQGEAMVGDMIDAMRQAAGRPSEGR